MASIARIPLGAPGLYPYPDIPLRSLTRVRMDVCAFVGVAPRGPVRVPIVDQQYPNDWSAVAASRPRRRTLALPVESFDEYKQLYGAFEGPGLLPYAVASFFEQGGRRAYIARVVHDYGLDPVPHPERNDQGVASGELPGGLSAGSAISLRARDEGAWGNRLRAALSFTAQPLIFDAATAATTGLQFEEGTPVQAGAMLRLRLPGGAQEFRSLSMLLERRLADQQGSVLVATFDAPASAVPESADLVEAGLTIDDGDGRAESYTHLGLSSQHPRYIATELCAQSALVWPDVAWAGSTVTPADASLAAPPPSDYFAGGADRFPDIVPDDFFDPLWTLGDEDPGNGVQCVAQLPDLSSLAAPDLYSPRPLVERKRIPDPVSLAGPEFARCVQPPVEAPAPVEPDQDLTGLRLDPKVPADREAITRLQQRLADLADLLRSFVVLLDVPPGLTQRRILNWRARFRTSYAAAYHPWLVVSRRDDSRNTRLPLPPSAAAAGIIAQVENTAGVPTGPANVIAAQVLDVDDLVSPQRHDELHPLGINVYLRERDGIRLTAARTLSTAPEFRQLSVRRLLVMIRRAVEQQMQWAVFEPNNNALRAEMRQLLTVYLRQLFRAGAFRGATEEEAFFVRCDDSNNPPRLADLGQLVVEIGVAPAEPLEFIVLRLSRDGDGTLSIAEVKG